nr:MAG TPA: hypothetical protein [Caudoviricetes sp.]
MFLLSFATGHNFPIDVVTRFLRLAGEQTPR